MYKLILDSEYGSIVVKDLDEIWVQKNIFYQEWQLCYKDKKWERKTIYFSKDKELLLKLKNKIIDAYVAGEKRVKV